MINETEEQRAAHPCMIARCLVCHNIIAAIVKDPDRKKDDAKEVASWVRDGLPIGEIAVAEVRSGQWCTCQRKQKQGGLL